MKEELIRVLNAKLNDISKNINSLMEINGKIDAENEKLSYATRILNGFKDGDTYNILNFAKLNKTDFEKVLKIVDNDVEKIFNSNNCNYDGLIYLINGINNGVSLSLTDEQKNGIEYLIRGLSNKEDEYGAVIDGLQLVKSRFLIDDLNVLNSEKDRYALIIKKIDENDYIEDTDKVYEAIEFSKINQNETVDLLTYLLEYNAKIYSEKKDLIVTQNNEKDQDNSLNEIPHEMDTSELLKEDDYNFSFNPIQPIDIPNVNENIDNDDMKVDIPVSVDDNHEIETNNNEKLVTDSIEMNENASENIMVENEENTIGETNDSFVNELPKNEINEIVFETPSFEISNDDEKTVIPDIDFSEIKEENTNNSNNSDTLNFEDSVSFKVDSDMHDISKNENINEIHPMEENIIAENSQIDDDFKDVVSNSDYYEEYNVEDEKTSNRELQRLFADYDIKELEINDELLLGNADNYRKVLETLKRNNILDIFKSNKELLKEVILSSGESEIEEILGIIKNDLSVDDEDYEITLNIAINTLPTIFIKDNGNYDNFVKNVKLFKKIGVNLINLFDFSKEVFIVDNSFVINNYNIVKKYNIGIDYKNAKYLLMLNNIAEKMDYYVESSYIDKTKDETFDGISYINNYAVKLNCVTDETIKRLRYASVNGKKVFGSKPNSLTGEITNLRVNVLEIDDNYRNSFFNNQFNGLTSEEVREFVKLTRNSSNVGNYGDELEKLEEYHNGLRYIINGILISYNKVIRNYNILRSYGINKVKALHFAICYNLVITKDEYENLRNVIEEIGGAF